MQIRYTYFKTENIIKIAFFTERP